jgi:hypothetical protein
VVLHRAVGVADGVEAGPAAEAVGARPGDERVVAAEPVRDRAVAAVDDEAVRRRAADQRAQPRALGLDVLDVGADRVALARAGEAVVGEPVEADVT